jgi:hypothetical protein
MKNYDQILKKLAIFFCFLTSFSCAEKKDKNQHYKLEIAIDSVLSKHPNWKGNDVARENAINGLNMEVTGKICDGIYLDLPFKLLSVDRVTDKGRTFYYAGFEYDNSYVSDYARTASKLDLRVGAIFNDDSLINKLKINRTYKIYGAFNSFLAGGFEYNTMTIERLKVPYVNINLDSVITYKNTNRY